MIRIIVLGTMLLALLAGYVALPFSTAWAIREAVTSGNSDYIARKVHWPRVRETMRQSMLTAALDLPEPGADAVESAAPPRRGLWTRVKAGLKSYAGRRVIDKMVETYISAEGFPRLYRQRMSAEALAGGTFADPESWIERFKAVWARVKRAEFKSPTAFEIEIEDQFTPDRNYVALLELTRLEWIMTELRVTSSSRVLPLAAAVR